MLSSEHLADSETVKGDMPRNVLKFITTLLGKPPIFPEPPLVWLPPKFEDVESYCEKICTEDAYLIDFGMFNDEPVRARLTRYVDCWGDTEFCGKGRMEIDSGLKIKNIVPVVVLGTLACTGTAILLDPSSQLWLYNVPDSVDRYFEGMKKNLALVKLPPTGMTKCAEVSFVEKSENVDVDVKDFAEFDDL